MKTKKKVTATEKAPQNKPKTIKTSDDKQFKVVDTLLMKYSNFFKSMIDDYGQDEVFSLPQVDSESFEIVNQFMQIHKEKEVSKIQLPIKSNQNLREVLEESDAILVEKVVAKGDDFLLKVLEAASYLQVQELKKRLIAGVAIKLMRHTVNELKTEYDLQDFDIKDQQIRQQAQKRLKLIHEIKDNTD